MVDEIVTRQELIDAKRDAQDLGKAVNEKVIVSPRYGEDFKSLPMIADEAQATIGEWESAIALITQEGGVPALAVSDASGVTQQEINDLAITPYHFGAIGDGTSHKLSERYTTLAEAQVVYPHAVSLDDEIDWCAIQKFANLYVASASNRKISFDMSGHFFVNRTCDFTIKNGTKYSGAYKCISGDHYFTTRSDFLGKTVLAFNGRGSVLTGITYIKGGNFVDYGVIFSDKSQPNSNTGAIAFGQGGFKIFVDEVRIRAVQFDGTSMFASVALIRGYDCGKSIEVTATSITNRTINSLDTRSDIVLKSDVSLPNLTQVNVFVSRGRDVARVVAYDQATRKLEVKTAFVDTGTTDKIKLFYGGLVGISGTDSAGIRLGVCSGVYTPIVIDNSAMYPVDITEVVSEFAHCSIYDGGLVGGLKIGTAYYEGDIWQYISNNSASATYGFTNIGKTTGFNIDKYTSILFPKNAEGYSITGLQGTMITEKDIVHRYEKPAYNENSVHTHINLNTPFEVFNRQFNSGTLQFTPINKQYNKLFGYDYKQVVVHGLGSDAVPTGNITFKPPTGWTINGGTVDVVFSGFTGPAKFDIKLRPATNDINITCSNLRSITLSNQSAIPSAYTNANDLPVDTKYWFANSTTVTNLPTPTTGAQNNGNIATYYSYGLLGSPHNMKQVVEYPTLHEKWERVHSSATGVYGVWKLKDYEVKKGTTAQRPSNPQLGMRYYDTTLLASGKPIEWNGANWVDSTGATV